MQRFVIIEGVNAFLTSSLGLARGYSVGTTGNTDSVA